MSELPKPIAENFYWRPFNRSKAEESVMADHQPIIRPSSQDGKLAFTQWAPGGGIIHSLITPTVCERPAYCFPVTVLRNVGGSNPVLFSCNSVEEIINGGGVRVGTPATNEDPRNPRSGGRRKTRRVRRIKRSQKAR